MIIKKIGRYKLTKDFYIRNTISCSTFPKGRVIQITQIDTMGQKVIGPLLFDWVNWDMPVIKEDD